MGVITMLLAACTGGGRADADAVQRALQDAAEDGPELADGTIHFQDRAKTGTSIAGVLAVNAAGDDVPAAFEAILERIARAYREQPRTRTASVLLEAHPADDVDQRIRITDILAPSSGATVTSDDLAAHFGL